MPRHNPIVLLTENDKVAPRGAVISTGSRRLIQPPNHFDWTQFSSVEIELLIRQVNGSPTAWSLKPRLEIGITTTFGYQFTNPFWKTLTKAQADVMCVDGWFPDINQSSSTPQLYTAIIKHPTAAMRINFGESGPDAFTMTGGTNPNLQIACVAYGRTN